MKFHQFFASVDVACLGVDDGNRLDIIQAFLLSDYEDEETTIHFWSNISVKKRKKRGKAEYTHNDCHNFLFSKKYLHHSNEKESLDEDSKFGKKNRLRFRVPYVFFTIIKDIGKKYKISPNIIFSPKYLLFAAAL